MKPNVRLPERFSLSRVPGRRTYRITQAGNDKSRLGWRTVHAQMLRWGYVRVGLPYWQRSGWTVVYIPAPRRAVMTAWLARRCRAFERQMRIPPGSPRETAPRFDGDSFGKVIERLGFLGFWMAIFLILIQTSGNITDLPSIDAQAARAPWIQAIGLITSVMTWPVVMLLMLISGDLAIFLAQRIYRLFGWEWVPVAVMLWAAIFIGSITLFGTLEVGKLLNTAIDAAR